MNRGARHQAVFTDDIACSYFLSLLGELPERHGIVVHAYALMPNHFHLLLSAGQNGLGGGMGYLQARYSRWLNQTRGWDGPLWRARFKSRRIDSEKYLGHVLAYIHLNPVASHLVTKLEQSQWTSHAAYVGLASRPGWLSTGEMLDLFGTIEAYRSYLVDMQIGRDVNPGGDDPGELFRTGKRVLPPSPPTVQTRQVHVQPLDLGAAWDAIERVTGLVRSQIENRSFGRTGNPAWWLALWWLPRATGMTRASLSRELGVHRSTWTLARKRLRARALVDREVNEWIESLAR
jgi:REP element-mobilizing transposase RayT